MDHDQAAGLLSDYVRGRLEDDRSRQVEQHLASCPECRGVLATARELKAEVAEHGAALFEPHPTPDELAGYALSDPGRSLPDLARVRAHLELCPTCRHEVAATRRLRAPGARARERLSIWFSPPPGHRLAWLPRAAVAVVVLGLLYPAYIGLQGMSERGGAGEPGAEGGGFGRVLYLGGTHRGGEAAPELRLAPHQKFVPIVLDTALPARLPDARFDVTITRPPAGAVVWQRRATGDALWDAVNASVTLIVPSSVLSPGEHSLTLRATDRAETPFTAAFRVIGRAES